MTTEATTTATPLPEAAAAPPEALLKRLRQGRRFLLSSHVNPDGDAIGSELGLARILRQLGKEVTVWNRDAMPNVYRPLPGSDEVHVGLEPPAGFPEAFDTGIVLECPSLDRTGLQGHLPQIPLLNIDHHLGNAEYGEMVWVDTTAPAVGEMVLRLAQGLGHDIDVETANALYLTLVTDTGGFRFSNANAFAFEAAAELVRRGAAPETVSHWLFESQPLANLVLLGEMLQSLALHHGGQIATVWLTQDMVQRAQAKPGDAEGLIDYPRSIAGVSAVALFKQLEDGRHKVSLRSRGAIDIEQVARRFGGGGHQNAAGFSSDERDGSALLDATLRSMIDVVEQIR